MHTPLPDFKMSQWWREAAAVFHSGMSEPAAAWRGRKKAAVTVQKVNIRGLTRFLHICVWVSPSLLGWPSSILNHYKHFLDLILGTILFSIQTQNLFWWNIQSLAEIRIELVDHGLVAEDAEEASDEGEYVD